MSHKPKWRDLSLEEKVLFNNGVGPYWLPKKCRDWLTSYSKQFFREASWGHHDFGYCIGYSPEDRLHCDNQFLRAMWRDSNKHSNKILAKFLAICYYLLVRSFGSFSFNYTTHYLTVEEALDRINSR